MEKKMRNRVSAIGVMLGVGLLSACGGTDPEATWKLFHPLDDGGDQAASDDAGDNASDGGRAEQMDSGLNEASSDAKPDTLVQDFWSNICNQGECGTSPEGGECGVCYPTCHRSFFPADGGGPEQGNPHIDCPKSNVYLKELFVCPEGSEVMPGCQYTLPDSGGLETTTPYPGQGWYCCP